MQNDCSCVCQGTKKPVLAHLILHFMLDNGIAFKNFRNFNGYQPPLNEIQPDFLIKQGSSRNGSRRPSWAPTTWGRNRSRR